MCQTDRRPLTTLATFSSYVHSGKLSSFTNSLTSFCDSANCCMAATTLTEPDPFMICSVDEESSVYCTSPSTGLTQPFASQPEQCASVQNLLTRSSQDMDSVILGTSDIGCSYNAVDYRTVCDTEYSSSMAEFTTPAPPVSAADAYQRFSCQTGDWTAGYQSVAAGCSMRSPAADVEDTKNHLLLTTIDTDQLPDSEQFSDDWSSSVTVKKIKQLRTEHGRRTTQTASRRASTGSLLYTTTPDLVSDFHSLSLSLCSIDN